MKNKILVWFGSLLMLVFTAVIVISCNKKFAEPPVIQDVVDTSITNHIISIKALKSLHTIGGFEAVTSNLVIAGIVSGDDKSGNLYKEITLQDSTGGIMVKLEGSDLYVDYPVGRKIYIKCNGLYLSDYGYDIELGIINNTVPANPTLTGIPQSLFNNYIVKGTLGNTIVPKIVTISQLNALATMPPSSIVANDSFQNTLVEIDSVQFSVSDTGYVYSDTSSAKAAVSRYLTDCPGDSIAVYTSGYADFAGFKLVQGKGNLKAIYTPYKKTPELIIRDTSDAPLYGTRCANTSPITFFSETFPGVTSKTVITTTGSSNVWQNIAEVGGVQYVGYTSTSGNYASISAYNAPGSPAVVTSWLITQAIKIPAGTTAPYLSFSTKDGYDNGATFKVLVSTNYNGSNTPSTSTWTQLTSAVIPTGTASGFSTATPSGNIDLSSYVGQTIYIGWRYDGTNTANTTYEFTNVQVVGF